MDILASWQEEKRSAYLYLLMAEREPEITRKKLFTELATAANKQALLWEQEFNKSGKTLPNYMPDLRARLIGCLIRAFGVKRLRYLLPAMKIRGMSVYAGPLTTTHFVPASGKIEHRHKAITTGGNLRAAVFGINDGLISNVSLILGIAGASTDQQFIILTGIAGLLAGACSMAAGEYISVRSQRELFENQIELERSELELYPQEEAAELALIYRARGVPEVEANAMAQTVISNPEQALNTLSREELGIDPNELASPWGAAISSFCSFAMGAFIPLLPFLFGYHHWNLLIAIFLAALALFIVGATLSFFTNRGAIFSGLRMLLIGAAAGGFTYLIGRLFGVLLS